MTKFLDSGAVIPHGLLSSDPSDFSRGTEKTYSTTALRFGVIKQIYSINDPGNRSRLSTEYDVDVIEQDKNRGIAPVTYKNCLSVDGLGSISDYFEKNFRVQTQSQNFQLPLTKGQNGATVLVLCLDATMGKGIILGGLNHPDRTTNLTSDEPQLYGEYNGVAVQISPDGSTSLTFKGATDNDGVPTNLSQGNTVFQIEADGSFQFNHSTITIQANRSGVLNITTASDTNITVGGNTNITTTGTANIIAQGTTTVDGSTIKLGVDAVQSVIRGNDFAAIFDTHTHSGVLSGPDNSGPPIETMDSSLSTHTFVE